MSRVLDLEKQITEENAESIRDEIDWEILCSMMQAVGYTKVKLPSNPTVIESALIEEWSANYAKGRVHHRGATWMFEKLEDAEWFTLRWVK